MSSPKKGLLGGRRVLLNQSEMISMGPVKRLADTEALLNMQVDSQLLENNDATNQQTEPQFLSLFPKRPGFESGENGGVNGQQQATKSSTEAYRMKGAVPVDDKDFRRKVQRGLVNLNEVTTPRELVYLPTETLKKGLLRVDAIDQLGRSDITSSMGEGSSERLLLSPDGKRGGGKSGGLGTTTATSLRSLQGAKQQHTQETLATMSRAPGGPAYIRYLNRKERLLRPDLIRGSAPTSHHQLAPLSPIQPHKASPANNKRSNSAGSSRSGSKGGLGVGGDGDVGQVDGRVRNELRGALPEEIANEAAFLARHKEVLMRLEETMSISRGGAKKGGADRLQQHETLGVSSGAVVAAGTAVAALHRMEELVGDTVTITCYVNEAISRHFAQIVTSDHLKTSSRPFTSSRHAGNSSVASPHPNHSSREGVDTLTIDDLDNNTDSNKDDYHRLSNAHLHSSPIKYHAHLPRGVYESLSQHELQQRGAAVGTDFEDDVVASPEKIPTSPARSCSRHLLCTSPQSQSLRSTMTRQRAVVDHASFYDGIDEGLIRISDGVTSRKIDRELQSKERIQTAMSSLCSNNNNNSPKKDHGGTFGNFSSKQPPQKFATTSATAAKVVISVPCTATPGDVITAVLARYVELRVCSGVFRHEENTTIDGQKQAIPIGRLLFKENSPFLKLTDPTVMAFSSTTTATKSNKTYSSLGRHLKRSTLSYTNPEWAPLVLLGACTTLYVTHPLTGDPLEELRRVVPLTSSWASDPPPEINVIKAAVLGMTQPPSTSKKRWKKGGSVGDDTESSSDSNHFSSDEDSDLITQQSSSPMLLTSASSAMYRSSAPISEARRARIAKREQRKINKSWRMQRERTAEEIARSSAQILVPLGKFACKFGISPSDLDKALSGSSNQSKRQVQRQLEMNARFGNHTTASAAGGAGAAVLDKNGILSAISTACSPEALKAQKKSILEPFLLPGDIEVVTAVSMGEEAEPSPPCMGASLSDMVAVAMSRSRSIRGLPNSTTTGVSSSYMSSTQQQGSMPSDPDDRISFYAYKIKDLRDVLARNGMKVLLTSPTLCTRFDGAVKLTPAEELFKASRDRLAISSPFSKSKSRALRRAIESKKEGAYHQTRLVIRNDSFVEEENEQPTSAGGSSSASSEEGEDNDPTATPLNTISSSTVTAADALAMCSNETNTFDGEPIVQRLVQVVTMPSSRPILKSILKKYLNLYQDVLRLEDAMALEQQQTQMAGQAGGDDVSNTSTKNDKKKRQSSTHVSTTTGTANNNNNGGGDSITSHPKFTLPNIMTALSPPYTLCLDISPTIEAIVDLQNAELMHRKVIEEDCYRVKFVMAFAQPYAHRFLNQETVLRQGLFEEALRIYKRQIQPAFIEGYWRAREEELVEEEAERRREDIEEKFWGVVVGEWEPMYEKLMFFRMFEDSVISNVVAVEMTAWQRIGASPHPLAVTTRKPSTTSPISLVAMQLEYLYQRGVGVVEHVHGTTNAIEPYETTHTFKLSITSLYERYQRETTQWVAEAIKEADRLKLAAQNDLIMRVTRERLFKIK